MNAGELRTLIRIEDRSTSADTDGYEDEKWSPIDSGEGWRHARWRSAYGTEAFLAEQAGISELATCIIRYTPRLTATCRVFRKGDDRPYAIYGVHALDDRRQWLEFKVQRRDESQ